MKIKFWGVRGSLPTPLPPRAIEERIEGALRLAQTKGEGVLTTLPVEQFGGYGGNTACVEVFTDNAGLIIDGGSGIRRKGYELLAGPCGKGRGEVHLVMTHLHWDHVIGLPLFTPLFIPGNTVHVYSVQAETEETFRLLFRKPNFPVPYDLLGATIIYHRLEPRKPSSIGPFILTPYRLDHPDPCWGYRIEEGGRVLAHCVDTECTRITATDMGEDRLLYHRANMMLFDAQYTLIEALEKVNWGHAAATIGLDIAYRERIDKVVFMHHDPAADDTRIADAVRQTRQYAGYLAAGRSESNLPAHDVTWCFAREEMVLDV